MEYGISNCDEKIAFFDPNKVISTEGAIKNNERVTHFCPITGKPVHFYVQTKPTFLNLATEVTDVLCENFNCAYNQNSPVNCG